MITYTALDNAVWFGAEYVCLAANERYAKYIADILNEAQKE